MIGALSPASISGTTTSTITLAVSSSAAVGTTSISIIGQASTGSHTKHIDLTVTAPPDFALALSPTSLSIAQGSTGTSQASVTYSGGFSSAVALSASVLPSGVTASFNPTSISGSTTSTITFTVGSSAATGTSSVSIVGTASTGSHTRHINLTVTSAAASTPCVPISAYSTGSGKISIYWTNSPNTTGYNVYRSTTAGGENYNAPINGSTPVNTASYSGSKMDVYTDTGLTNGTVYYYTIKAVYGSTSSVASNEDSDTPDPAAVPWDTRNVGTIVGAFQSAFSQEISDIGDGPFDDFQVAGPDGTIYDSGSGTPQLPSGTIAPGTNQYTGSDGSVYSLPDEDGQILVDAPATQAIRTNAIEPHAVGTGLADSPGPYRSVQTTTGYRGSYGYFSVPSCVQRDPDDTCYFYLGYNSANCNVDAGLQYDPVHGDWEPYMLVEGKAVSYGKAHANPADNYYFDKNNNKVYYVPAVPITNYMKQGPHIPANTSPACGFWAWGNSPAGRVLKLSMFVADDYALGGDGPLTGIGCASTPDVNHPENSIYIKRVHAIAQKEYGVKNTGSYQEAGAWFQGQVVLPGLNDPRVAWQPPNVPTPQDGAYQGGQTLHGIPVTQGGTAAVDANETSKFVQEDNIEIFISQP